MSVTRSPRLIAVTAFLIGLLAIVAWAPTARAESITSLQVEAELRPDTTLQIRETITYDFGAEDRHGIFRDIPVADVMPDGSRRLYDVTIDDVTIDGNSEQFEQSVEDPYLRLKIGDPYATITGSHTYVITYTVADALRIIKPSDVEDPQVPSSVSAGDAELYWDFVGTGWQVPIEQAMAALSAPAPSVGSRCFTGPAGQASLCPTDQQGNVTTFGPASVQPGEALTGVAVYPADAFTAPVTERIEQPRPDYFLWGLLAGIVGAVLLVLIPAMIAVSRRKADAGVSMPLAPPVYSPPDDLTPAELAAGWQGENSDILPRVVVATLLDLTARRWVDLDDVGGSMQVTWLGTGSPALRPWEETLLSGVLKGQPSAIIGAYDPALAGAVESVYATLVAEAEKSGRRNVDGDAPDRRWNFLGLVGLGCLGIGILSIFIGITFLAGLFIPMGIGAFIGLVVARAITPRRENVQSATFLSKVAGFEKVLKTPTATSRREFAHRSGLTDVAIFATMLPYAVIFDAEAAWARAFPDLTPEQLSQVGYHATSTLWMASFMANASNSMATSMTPPSTSSGSGMGGGGFSGGGGGGGGGGSW